MLSSGDNAGSRVGHGLVNVRDTAQAKCFSSGFRVEGVGTTHGYCRTFLWVDVLLLSNIIFNFNSVKKDNPFINFLYILILLACLIKCITIVS